LNRVIPYQALTHPDPIKPSSPAHPDEDGFSFATVEGPMFHRSSNDAFCHTMSSPYLAQSHEKV